MDIGKEVDNILENYERQKTREKTALFSQQYLEETVIPQKSYDEVGIYSAAPTISTFKGIPLIDDPGNYEL